MILITGATGRIGRRVVERLVAAQQSVRVLVRDQEKARRLLPDGVEIIEGDLCAIDVVRAAVDGTQAVLLLSTVAPDQVELQGNVVKAALASSRPYIVKISGLATALDSYVDSGRWHAETEQQIKAGGLPYTFLRPLFFMQNLSFLIASATAEGLIRSGVGDAKIAMVDVEDIAAVAAQLLIERRSLMNQAVTLTAAECVTYDEVAQALGQVLEREVRYQPQTLSEVQRVLRNSDQPGWHVDILLQFNQAFIDGYGDAASEIVADVLGRKPTTLLQYLERETKHSAADDSSNPFPS
jgi:uncharacterized protein YbjT (DUF2867 family)